jgi:hypothetical protein
MSTTYPAGIRRPLLSGYGLTIASPNATTERDRTTARTRGTATASTCSVALTWHFTAAEFQTFAAWFRTDLQHGALPASMALINGYADAVQSVQFLGPYRVTDRGGGVLRVEAEAQMTAPPRLSAADMAGLIAMGGSLRDGPGLVTALHYLVHTTLPTDLP